jgi:L-aspartate oxidase
MDEKFDVVVLGSGIAGLTAALQVDLVCRVLVLSKVAADETNTLKAQGGIASVFSPDDSYDLHVADTIGVGGGLCVEEAVRQCVEEGPGHIRWLESLGVSFSHQRKASQETFDLGREGGHSRRRVVHARDMTGREVELALLQQVRERPNIVLRENSLVVDLVILDSGTVGARPGRCLGCYVMDRASGEIHSVGASATVLATGGAGKVYLYTSNPDIATGDGVAMAWRAGAWVENMEFFQFHPTCLFHPMAKNFLISEAVRGEGGILLTQKGERFMPGYHAQAELAPRDVVARAIDLELKKSGDDHVLLDISHRPADFVRDRFPGIHGFCLRLGMDISKDPIPVVPAAHYQCGGVKVDSNGWTGIPGLYAAGEVACTGMHGANRLASNSLLEALVWGRRAARTAMQWLEEVPPGPSQLTAWHAGLARHPDEAVVISQNWDEIRRFMWNYVGLVRSDDRLHRARKRLSVVRDEVRADYWSFILTPDLVELRNLADVAFLILEMAIVRKESRGLHYNLDHPELDDSNWQRTTVLRHSRRPGRI